MAPQDQVLCRDIAHNDSITIRYEEVVDKMDRMGTGEQQVVLAEEMEEMVGWEVEEQVLGSLVLHWLQDSTVSENNTEGNDDLLEVWVAW